ncbi:hypothetical protein ACET3X_003947 [Alternaria dauci]|uniref:Uncharacterized protein n=1 Tax=Alternaria dauci TaxID=48095 RepID=A0ABR3ULH9_9PLEO
MAAVSPEVLKSQYEHYIPRFLLRRFSYPSTAVPNHGKRRNRKQRVEDVVAAVDLGHDIPKFVELPVARIFGQFDMYKDDSKFSSKAQNRIEAKLCLIEGQASRIIAKVADAHKAAKDGVTLSRHDKDLLRKYIFVMKYRSPIFFKRFNHQRADDYDSSDRALFLEYMQERGFRRPLDVWFDNLEKIIDKPMDPAGKWTEDLSGEIYPADAEWVKINIRSMYLSFVTSSDANQEFLLTNNAFGIHEGPVDCLINPATGEQTITAYTEFHVISVVSPHLVMILRHSLLPEPLEDQRDEIRNNKRWMLAACMQAHSQPGNAMSLLHDLPIAKARNSYTVIQDGRLELAECADMVPKARDTFYFTFFRLESRHVQTINLVMLDQVHHSSHIVYKSTFALRAALDFYLDFPTRTRGAYSLKTISDRPDDPMLLSLRRLETIAHSLGSSVKAKYHIDPLGEVNERLPLEYAVAQILKTIDKDFPTVSLSALPAIIMSEVVNMLEVSIQPMKTLDLMAMADKRRCFPDQIFRAVHKADTRRLSTRNKGILHVDLPTWRSKWDELVKQGQEMESAEINRNIKRFESIRSYLDQISVRESPELFAATERAQSFNKIVPQVLETADTGFLGESLANDVLALPMTIMIEVVVKQEMDVMSTQALNMILIADGRPCFPDMVYSGVLKAHIKDCSERVKRLVKIDLMIWRSGWEWLVKMALEKPGATLDETVAGMREVLRRLPPSSLPSPDSFPALASAVSRNTTQTPRESPVRRPRSYNATKGAPEHPRTGRFESFLKPVRIIQENGHVFEDALRVFSLIALVLSFMALICFCLVVLAQTLFSLTRFLVVLTWNFAVLVWRIAL